MSNLLNTLSQPLEALYPQREAKTITRWALEDILHFKPAHLDKNHINYREKLTDEEQIIWDNVLKRLLNAEPLQYISERADFYGLQLFVNNNVLIPRPETEELVHWILEDYDQKKIKKIIDIGTGSGCIALSLQKNRPIWEITALDVSEKALDVAKINSIKLGLSQIKFEKIDFLDDKNWNKLEKYDIVVSNPPYIGESEKNNMRANVAEYEPALALFVPDDNIIIFYEKLAEFCKTNLNEKGSLYVEIHADYGSLCLEYFKKTGIFKNISLQKDMSGRDRMMKLSF